MTTPPEPPPPGTPGPYEPPPANPYGAPPPAPPPADPSGTPPAAPASPYGAPPYGSPTSPYGSPASPYGSPASPYGAPAYPTPASSYGTTQPYQYGGAPPASRSMAGWALGLSLAFFCWPLTTLVSIGLAIGALRRGRDGRDHGRGMAIGALVVDAIALVVTVGIVLIAVLVPDDSGSATDDPSDTPPPTVAASKPPGATEAPAFADAVVGDCVDLPDVEVGGDTSVKEDDLEQRPCDEDHIAEVFLTDTLYLDPVDAPYPGAKATSKIVSGKCRAGFEAYVGVPFRRSELSLTFIYPRDESWAAGDHGFTCLVGFPDSGAHTGSLAGSKP